MMQPPAARSERFAGFALVCAAIVFEAVAIGAGQISTGLHPSSLTHAVHDLAALIFAFVAAVLISVPLARMVFVLPETLLRARIAARLKALQAYSRPTGWPGRRYLELLRSGELAKQRREFLALSMDSHLVIPSTRAATDFNRVSTILVHLEAESGHRGLKQLGAVARNALHQLRAYFLLARLRSGVRLFCFFAVPAAVAYLNVLLVERTAVPGAGLDGIATAMLTVLLIVGAPVVTYLLGEAFFFLTWTIGHRTESAVDDVLLQSLSWVAAAVPGIALLWTALSQVHNWPPALQTAAGATIALLTPAPTDRLAPDVQKFFLDTHINTTGLFILRLAAITGTTVLAIVLLRTLSTRVMREVAARTRQKYDDMMVELARIFGTFILTAIGFGWVFMVFISAYGKDLADSSSNGSLMPYAIIIAVAGAVLGVGSRHMLENFFAGVSLQVDRPFEPGERVVLESGAVCEVRSVGMRSTHFYNITTNADLYVPNTRLAQELVSNLSRPDRQHRRTLTVFAKDDGGESLRCAEDLVLVAAFTVEGVDVPTIVDEHAESASFQKGRPGVVAEFVKLQEHHEEFSSAVIRLHGQVQPIAELVASAARQLSKDLGWFTQQRPLVWDGASGVPANGASSFSLGVQLKDLRDTARRIERGMSDLGACFWTLGAAYPALRGALEPLSLEILRSPTVRSRQVLHEGASVWEIELSMYAHLTEQSDAVLHDLNLMIQRLFGVQRILVKEDAK
jgi:small-conductance mechanosensitive channel